MRWAQVLRLSTNEGLAKHISDVNIVHSIPLSTDIQYSQTLHYLQKKWRKQKAWLLVYNKVVNIAPLPFLVFQRDVHPKRILSAMKRLASWTLVPGSVMEMNVFNVHGCISPGREHFSTDCAHYSAINFQTMAGNIFLIVCNKQGKRRRVQSYYSRTMKKSRWHPFKSLCLSRTP